MGETSIVMSLQWLVVILLSLLRPAAPANILLMPLPTYSHVNPMITIGQILMDNGHDVFVFLPHLYNHMANLKASSKIKVIEYPIKAWEWNTAMHAGRADTDMDYFDYITQASYIADLKAKSNGYHLVCKAVMMSKIIDRNLKVGLTFDLAIVDSSPLARCNYALAYKYGIPYISYMLELDPWLMKSPAVPSYVPAVLAESLTDRMSFWQRIVNVWTLVYWNVFASLPTFTDDYIETYVPDKDPISVDELVKDTKLWLSDSNFLLDYSRPVSSNEVLVSLAMMDEAPLIPKSIEAIFTNATLDGVIVVSLDQNIPLPSRVVSTLLKTFKVFTTYQFLWQHSMDVPDESMPGNVKDFSLLPLQAVMGHPKTKLLITSADNLDQNIALYHGLPVLCVPLDGHQRYNAKRTEHRGYGTVLNAQGLNVKLLHNAIRKLLFDANETEAVREASEIMRRHQPMARKSLVDWVNISLQSNLTSIKPYAMEMPWHRYLLVDIAILVGLLAGNILFIFWNACGLCYQKVKDTKQARKMQSDIVVKVQQVINQNKATVTVPTVTPIKNIKQH